MKRRACFKCGLLYEPTAAQLKNYTYVCPTCRQIYKQKYREQRAQLANLQTELAAAKNVLEDLKHGRICAKCKQRFKISADQIRKNVTVCPRCKRIDKELALDSYAERRKTRNDRRAESSGVKKKCPRCGVLHTVSFSHLAHYNYVCKVCTYARRKERGWK